MSARQIRNLQNLVKAFTGADEDDDDVHSSSHPSTMKPANTNRKSRKTTKQSVRQTQNESQGVEEGLVTETLSSEVPSSKSPLPVALPLSEGSPTRKASVVAGSPVLTDDKDKCVSTSKPTDKVPATKKAATQAEAAIGPARLSDSFDDEPPAEIDAKRKKARGRRDNRARRREAELEDEQLLEAALRRTEAETNALADSSAAGAAVAEGEGGQSGLLALLSLCNPDWLDTRRERIRRFGPAAVGDVGDGRASQRRGAARATSNLFPAHHGPLPMFRHSCLATPNRYCWRAFNGHGVFLAVDTNASGKRRKVPTCSQSGEETIEFVLNSDSPEARRADAALSEQLMMIGDIEELYECLYRNPYHIPTLLAAYDMFKTMGNTANTQEVTNLALYHVGVLFSRFPIRQTSLHRQLPFSMPSNGLIFKVLMNGVQMALDMGATRTAWELSKFVYSLDPTDPCAILPQLDYMALRAKAWGWILHVYYIITNEEATGETTTANKTGTPKSPHATAESFDDNSAGSEVGGNVSLASALGALPGFFFSAALAKHFLQRELLSHAAAAEKTPEHKTPKVLRDMTPQETYAMQNTEPAAAILARAIRRFPSAAVLLFDRLGGVEATLHATPPAAWRAMEESHARTVAAHAEHIEVLEAALKGLMQPWLVDVVSPAAMLHHITSTWATRNAEIWRGAIASEFLRHVVTEENGMWLTAPEEAIVPAKLPWVHRRLFGANQRTAVVPAHLLNPHAVTEEDEREYARHFSRELTPLENDALLRFQSLFGPLSPPEMSPEEQLQRYAEMFESTGAEERMGAEHSRLGLFLRTLLPGNDLRDMALRATLRSEDIVDPVAERNRRRRAEDEVFWQQQEEEDELAEYGDGVEFSDDDDDEWHTEESWEADDSHA